MYSLCYLSVPKLNSEQQYFKHVWIAQNPSNPDNAQNQCGLLVLSNPHKISVGFSESE